MSENSTDSFDHKAFLAILTSRPGVYQMLGTDGEVLYIGKARNLRNRVGSYFRASGLTSRTMAMVDKIRDIAITVTSSDTEALLLEQNLIKSHRPPYNIVLRDDKSYPYILLTDRDKYPRLSFYRGSRKREGSFFGPYPSAHATRETLQILQKVFRVRQCEDTYFKNRSRPCLQYQIARCSGPCVDLISPEDYAQAVYYSKLFLQGKSDQLTRELSDTMEQAAAAQDFERAAQIRDQIIELRKIQSEQVVANQGGDADVLAAALEHNTVCVHLVYVRGGRIIGSKSFYPRVGLATSPQEVLEAFIAQMYLGDDKTVTIPSEIIVPGVCKEVCKEVYKEVYKEVQTESREYLPQQVSQEPRREVSQVMEPEVPQEPQQEVSQAMLQDVAEETRQETEDLEKALSYVAGRRIRLRTRVRGHRAKWVKLAQTTATESLRLHISNKQNTHQRFLKLQSAFRLESHPERIECFDISHTSGENTVASCVVFDENGMVKSDYRRFSIKDITPGDDYAAMEQVLDRRFTRLSRGEGKIPDILLIDGGKGQLTQARKILEKFQLPEVVLIGIAKGISRRAGQETLFLGEGLEFREIALNTDSPALLLLQQVRDEAHRFAITGHRQRRSKARKQSILEDIPGLGPKRRRALLRHFGGQQEIRKASTTEIAQVTGISEKLAENIYGYLHNTA